METPQPQLNLQTVVDPFEFEEDPVVFEPQTKPSGFSVKQDPNYVPHYQQQLQQNSQGIGSGPLPQQMDEMGNIVEEVVEMKEQQDLVEKIVKDVQEDSDDTKDSKVK